MSAVTEEFGGIDVTAQRLLGEVKKGYTSFLAGDVLFAKITPCMENGKLALVSRYLHLFLTAGAGGRGQLNREAYGAGKPGLNLQQVSAVLVPIPGEQEIAALMQAVTLQFDAVLGQEAEVERALNQSAAQRKNILKAAFSGQLVPQDPADEPASVLLERIRAERATRAANGEGKRGRRKVMP